MTEGVLPNLKVYEHSEKSKGIEVKNFDGVAIVLLKPNAMSNGYISEKIIKRLTYFGEILVRKEITISKQSDVEEHYIDSKGKYYYPPIVAYMSNKPVIALVLRSNGVIEKILKNERLKAKHNLSDNESFQSLLRKFVIGPSDPHDTDIKHIRNMAIQHNLPVYNFVSDAELPEEKTLNGWRRCQDNLVHFSDSATSAEREYKIWFKK